MSAFKIVEAKQQPEFNIFYFAELHGSTRIEHYLMESLEKYWNEWEPHLKAYTLKQPEGSKGTDFLLPILIRKWKTQWKTSGRKPRQKVLPTITSPSPLLCPLRSH
jgi:hypothetical protein